MMRTTVASDGWYANVAWRSARLSLEFSWNSSHAVPSPSRWSQLSTASRATCASSGERVRVRVVGCAGLEAVVAEELGHAVEPLASEGAVAVAHEQRMQPGHDDARDVQPERADVLRGQVARDRLQARGGDRRECLVQPVGGGAADGERADLGRAPGELRVGDRLLRTVEAQVRPLVDHVRVAVLDVDRDGRRALQQLPR